MRTLTKQELKETRRNLVDASGAFQKDILESMDSEDISNSEYKDLLKGKKNLDAEIIQITGKILRDIEVDIEDAEQKISVSIDKAKIAIRQTKEVNKKLEIIKSVVDLAGAIVSGLKTFSVANVATIIDKIARFI